MKSWGDEVGFFWDTPIKVGRESVDGVPRPKADPFRQAAPPSSYELPTLFPQISRHPRIIIDIEGYDPYLQEKGPGTFRKDGFICGVGVRTDNWEGEYYPVRHKDAPNLDPEKVFSWLRSELKDYKGVVVGANLLYDGEWLGTEGVSWSNATVDDPQWAAPLLDENQFSYKLDKLAQREFGEHKVTHELVEKYGPSFIKQFHRIHPGHARAYVMGDLDLPMRLMDAYKVKLEKDDMWTRYDIERRNYHFLLYMRQQGVRVDFDAAEKLGVRLRAEQKLALDEIKHMTGYSVNVWAADSLAKAFTQQGIEFPRTEKKKKPSFKKDWLNAHESRLAELVSKVRKLDKFDGTFVQSYLKDAVNGRLHCQFHPLRSDDYGTVSGRFSSTHPNLQQVPKRDDIFGPLVRGLFIPEEGCRWWSKDYSQIEYRFLVHYAVVARCLGANVAADLYRNNPDTDFHELAALLTGKPRKTAKNINFGIVYGMGEEHMAEVMGCTRAKAKEILAEYHGKMPFAREIYKMASNKALATGFIRTILGGRRHFDLWEPTWFDRSAEKPKALPREEALETYGPKIKRAYGHKALNSLLQGSAAELNKKAMVDVWESGLVGPGKPLQAHLTVHDELDGSYEPNPQSTEALAEVERLMVNAIPLQIPVMVSSSEGKNWAEAH